MGEMKAASTGEYNEFPESGKLQRSLVCRFPTKRGNIKKQIFFSVGQSLVELLKALRKRGGSLGKQRDFVIAALWKMYEHRKGNPKASSSVETMSLLWSEGVQNWYDIL
ncbi:hypothetical protein SUGI_0024830 [Cryptomeria japonica]|nr:hypothetical protein SUGI_0024830 [Cryptomeria japonica]